MAYRPIETSHYRLHASRNLSDRNTEYEFLGRIHHLKERLLDLAKVAFWFCQKSDNPTAGCVETMKHRFMDFTNGAFCDIQKADK
jgi:hypothetical protein